MANVDLFGIFQQEWRRAQIWFDDALYSLEQMIGDWGWTEYGVVAVVLGLAGWVVARRQR